MEQQAEIKNAVSDPKIRQAHEEDTDAVLDCLLAAFAPYREQYTPAGFADTVLDRSTLRARMRVMHVLVAVRNREIVGTVAGEVRESGEGHLRGMAVLPQCKGTGVAHQLLIAIEAWLQAQGCTRITLDTTLPLQAAMKFYTKHGYSHSEHTSDFFGMPLLEYSRQLD